MKICFIVFVVVILVFAGCGGVSTDTVNFLRILKKVTRPRQVNTRICFVK